jgi:AcrR family transcriptional regulator
MASPAAGPPATASRERRVRLPAERRRAQLLDVAATMLVDRGVEAVTMEGVAARAGVSKALGYRYFENATELLLALADREMQFVSEQVLAGLRGTTTFEESLRASLTAWFDVLAERGTTIVVLLQTPTLAGPLGERRRALRDAVADFYGLRAAAAFDLSPNVARVATAILLAGLEGVIESWIDERVPRRELIDIYTTMTLSAYRALADDPPVIGEPSPPR